MLKKYRKSIILKGCRGGAGLAWKRIPIGYKRRHFQLHGYSFGGGGGNGTTQYITGMVGGNNQPLKLLFTFLGLKKNRVGGVQYDKETTNCRGKRRDIREKSTHPLPKP